MNKAKSKKAEVVVAPVKVDWKRAAMIGLCLVGLLVAGYLTWAEMTGNETQCINRANIDCKAVQNSAYAKTLGIPVALTGLLGYVAILAVLLLEDQTPLFAAYGRTLVVAFALFGVMFSVYLSLIEATVLDAWCQWCIASAVVITLLLILGVMRLYDFLRPLRA